MGILQNMGHTGMAVIAMHPKNLDLELHNPYHGIL